MPITDHYAYTAEAALAAFTDAHLMRQECDRGRERLVCVLFARSARSALVAMCAAQGTPVDAMTVNLMALVAPLDGSRLRQAGQAYAAARLLTRVLILDQLDAGAGYVTRDLFDQVDMLACEAAAKRLLEICCRRLLHCGWEDALIRFEPFRTAPMTDTRLWSRRAIDLSTRRVSR